VSEWNPSDPDAARVFYDLSEWDFDQQAELASALADVEIPHSWEGSEVVVPEEFEDATDAVFADVEQRLNIVGKGLPDDDDENFDDGSDSGEPVAVRELTDDMELTEFDLDEWEQLERTLVTDSLVAANIPHRWDGNVLLVPTDDEASVDAVLDEVESGDVIPVINDGGDEIPFESLNSFFLAGERLRKHPHDADGLERLLEALKIADPNRPPRGVELGVWRRSCELAETLADHLVEETDSEASEDEITAAAADLHDLLRPLI